MYGRRTRDQNENGKITLQQSTGRIVGNQLNWNISQFCDIYVQMIFLLQLFSHQQHIRSYAQRPHHSLAHKRRTEVIECISSKSHTLREHSQRKQLKKGCVRQFRKCSFRAHGTHHSINSSGCLCKCVDVCVWVELLQIHLIIHYRMRIVQSAGRADAECAKLSAQRSKKHHINYPAKKRLLKWTPKKDA